MEENPYKAPMEQSAGPVKQSWLTWQSLVIGAFIAAAIAVNIYYLVLAVRSPPGLTFHEALPPAIMWSTMLVLFMLRTLRRI